MELVKQFSPPKFLKHPDKVRLLALEPFGSYIKEKFVNDDIRNYREACYLENRKLTDCKLSVKSLKDGIHFVVIKKEK